MSGDWAWGHTALSPSQHFFQISLDNVLLVILLGNDGKSAQQRENPAKPKLKPLCPRPEPSAHATR